MSMHVAEILRGFRKHIKSKFETSFGHVNNRRWTDEKFRQKVQTFFTKKDKDPKIKQGYKFQEDFYKANEVIFCSLIQ